MSREQMTSHAAADGWLAMSRHIYWEQIHGLCMQYSEWLAGLFGEFGS